MVVCLFVCLFLYFSRNSKKLSSSHCAAQLEPLLRVTIAKWRGQSFVDIRKYYATPSGTVAATKKGIRLNVKEWEALLENQQCVAELLD